TLILSKGVPMLLAGDEVANGQDGNNNAYCQDNKIGWIDWSALNREGDDLTGFIELLTDIRRMFPQLRSNYWFDGKRADGHYDIMWLRADGVEFAEEDWQAHSRFLSFTLPHSEHPPLFVVINGAVDPVAVTMPSLESTERWRQLTNTARKTHEGL